MTSVINDTKENDIIDDNWIEQEKQNLPFDVFYKDCVENISTVFIYIDNGKIIHIKKNKFNIVNDCITDEQIYTLIMDNKTIQHTNFYIDTMFKYNFTIDPTELTHYVENERFTELNNFLKEQSHNFSVRFDQSIKLFENLNSLYFIMTTRNSNNKTRRIYVNRENKKTRRKY